MHVLFLPSFYPYPEKPVSGIFFKEQALALQQSGMNVRIAYVEPRRLQAITLGKLKESHFQISRTVEDGLETLRLRGWNPLMQTIPGALIWSKLTEHLVSRYIHLFGQPDLIHAHNSLWAGYAASQIYNNLKIPYVLTEHSSLFTTGAISSKAVPSVVKTLKDARYVVAVSSHLANSVNVFQENRVDEIVPNVVNTDFFALPATAPPELPFVFLGVAHLSEKKGYHLLIKAFAKVFKGDLAVQLEIGGDGPQKTELENLCTQLGLERQVAFLGALSQEEVRSALWRANAFVLPSFQETFGVVLIEAMATGLPVIASKCGGPDEIVNLENGYLFDVGDVDALAEALQELKSKRYSRQSIRAQTVSRYSRKSIASILSKIYRAI
jgi:glycosyltransferase involved in cell wall biosynthesis